MKIIIYGATELGCMLATEFFEDHDIIIIDKEENKSEEFNNLDISFVCGTATNANALRQAEIDSADVFIAATPNDDGNIVACLSAKKLGRVRTICFVSKEEYILSGGLTKEGDFPCEDLFIDYMIWPEELLTQEIFRIVTVAHALDVENFAGGKARLLEYRIKPESQLVNKKISECEFPQDTLIVGITRDSKLFIPYGETILTADDKLILMGTSHSLDLLAGKFFRQKESVKSATVIGGGNVGFMLAKNLESLKIKTKIIERNLERCEFLSQELSHTLVIQGDGTDLKILDEEEIGTSDVLISVTNNDEKNLLCSLLAKQLGVKRVISRVSKNLNIPLFEKVGVDVAISPKSASLNEVRNDLTDKDVDILATVEQGQGEVMEVVVPQELDSKKIMELRLPQRAVIGIAQRKNNIFIPKGDFVLKTGDELILFTLKENSEIIKGFFKVK